MRYAIVSDIHANLQAWNAVLIDIRSQPVDRILCLGDVVGYGPNPAETLRSAHAHIHDFVLGNHDAALCGKMESTLFNDHAQRILNWTRDRLNRQATRFLERLPLSLTGPGFRCTHGSFDHPARFDYVVEPDDARRCWEAVAEPLLFCGHTHIPCIYVIGASGTPHRLAPQDFVVEPGKRYLVNPGSVGQSRDGDIRAGYLIYDDQARSVVWRRVPFDLDGFDSALKAAGFRDDTAWFMDRDPRQRQPPLRELLGFNPPAEPDAGLRDTLDVREIQVWKHRAGLWRKRCAMLGVLAVSSGLGGAGLYRHYGNPGRVIRGPAVTASAPLDATGNRLPAFVMTDGSVMPAGWSARLGNRWRHALQGYASDSGETGVTLSSETDRVAFRLSALPVEVRAGQRYQLRASIRKQPDFQGSIAVVIGLRKGADHDNERIPRFVVQEPTIRLSDGWERAQRTFTVPAGGIRLEYHIDGLFTGTVDVQDVELLPR